MRGRRRTGHQSSEEVHGLRGQSLIVAVPFTVGCLPPGLVNI
jgi:hypothetical protein